MSRVVVVIDSNTGAVIDVAGNKRETGRYAKFIKRMLSLDKNPTLNYGFNGGDTLTISKNGNEGATVNIKAKVLNVSGQIKSNGQTLEEIASDRIQSILDKVYGTDGEIDVTTLIDAESGEPYIQISLNASIVNQLAAFERDLNEQAAGAGKFVTKEALAEAISGITIEEEDGIDELKEKFSTLLENLATLASEDSSGSSS
jgi:hypothetical protein